MSDAEELVAELHARHDEAVRAVATYSEREYEIHYSDEPVSTEYTVEDFEDIHDDVVLQDIEQPFQESLFHDLGEVRGKLRLFEQGTVAHFWPTDGTDGLLVVLGPEVDPGPRSLLELADEYYS